MNNLQLHSELISEQRVITLREITDVMGLQYNKQVDKVLPMHKQEGFGEVLSEKISTKGRPFTTYSYTKKQALMIGARLDSRNIIKLVNKLEELSKPLSPGELLVQSALRLLEIEKEQERQNKKLNDLEARVEHTNGKSDYFTVIGYLAYRNLKRVGNKTAGKYGRDLSRICRLTGKEICTTSDARYGRVNTYPIEVLDEYFL
jgi:predicted ArsR family transcriptional regulator